MSQLVPTHSGGSVVQTISLPMHTSADSRDISIAELFRTLRKRKLLIVFVVLIATGLALGVSLYMTPKYEATAVIEVNKEASDMIGDAMSSMMAEGSASDSLDYNVTLQTHARALQSDSLVFQVANQLGLEKREEFMIRPGISFWPVSQQEIDREYQKPLDESPRRRALLSKAFEKNLSIKTVPGTRLIEVHFFNRDPQVAANIANTLVTDYLEQYFKTRYAATAQASEWLSKQLADLKSQVEDSEQKLVEYQKKAGLLGTDDEVHSLAIAKLESLDKQLTSAEMDRIMAETVARLVKAGNPELISAATAGSGLLNGGTGTSPSRLTLLQSLRAQEAQLKMQYAQASTKYGAAFPALIQMRNQMKDLDTSIQVEMDKLSARAENDYQVAKVSEDQLRESFEKEKVVANQLNDAAIHYTIQKHEVTVSRELYDTLLTKLKSAGILSGLQSTNVVVIDPARTTPEPARPIYPLNVGIGLAFGLFGGIALAFVREGADNTIRSPEQAEEVSDLPTLTVIPEFKGGGRKTNDMGVSVLDHPSSPMAEAYRLLRTSILLSQIDRPPKVIMVTSALPQDGKSTTSMNMAITLAQQGSKVLLVDADLRRPKLQNMPNISSDIGLSTLMTTSDLGLPLYQSHPAAPNLSVLTAGVRPPYPAELLGSQRMSQLVKYWREQYDFVVIDTPPVLAVADPIVMSQHADAILFVVRYQQTTKQSLLRSRDLLLRANAKIAGLVLNRMNTNSLTTTIPTVITLRNRKVITAMHAINLSRFDVMVQNKLIALVIVCASLFGGQSLSAQSAAPEPLVDAARIKIGPGDLLQVAVFDEPELAQTLRVNDKGNAELLLLGTLHVAGLPTAEAQNLIEKLLKTREYLLDPHVSVIITEYQTQNVSLLGEVRKPGVYPLLGARDLPNLISLAGGTTPIASSTVTIKRRSGIQEIVKMALSNNPDEMLASQLELEPGDTVMVPKAGIVYVLGEVGKPGGFVMQDNGAMSLTQAVAFAAGVTRAAADTKARIIHKRATGLEESVVNLKRVLEGKESDVRLEPEDIVYIPSSAMKSLLTRAPIIAQSAASAAVYQGVTALP